VLITLPAGIESLFIQ